MGTLTIEAIKEAIIRLPEEERVSLAAWLSTMDDWDKQMLSDFSPGHKQDDADAA